MGKDWLIWASGGGKSTKHKQAGRSESRGGGAAAAEREAVAAGVAAPPTGCMCAVLQLFDLHQFQFPALHHQPNSFSPAPGSFLDDHREPCTANEGLEAPRNSLELDGHHLMESNSSSSSIPGTKEQQNLNIPVTIQIKTTRENNSPRASFSKATKTTVEDIFSDSCSSNSPAAGNKTPTLVARLMGLDQLPSRPRTSTTPPPLSALNSQGLHSLRGGHQQTFYSGLSGHQFLKQNRSCSNRSFFEHDIITAGSGTLSLPETPRLSSASRRSDVDHGHRLSLQINKENIAEEFEIAAYSTRAAKNLARKRRQLINKQADEENRRSGGNYAREIVKQVKESVSRKVGLDITNTIKRRDQTIMTNDDHVVLLKPKKPSKVIVSKGSNESVCSKQSPPSCSPRPLDPTNKPSHSPRLCFPSQETQQSHHGNVHSTQKPQTVKSPEDQQNSVALKKCKRIGNEKYSSRIRKSPQVVDPILKKKEEPFIRPSATNKGHNVTDKNCKKTPISNDILNISVPTLLPVKKQWWGKTQSQASSSSSSTDGVLRKRGTQISSCSIRTYTLKEQQKEVTHMFNFRENNPDRRNRTTTSTPTSTSSGDQVVELEYRHYIQRILKHAGIDKATPVSSAKWYSPSHPLDPSIFHYIELFHSIVTANTWSPGAKDSSELSLKCNRNLVFQLVDELLADILKPCLAGSRPCCWLHDQMYGAELIDTLWSRIKKFPRADCKVLEDIDALIDADIGKGKPSSWSGAHANEEEGEGIVEEIQREIMKSLVHEVAMAVRLQEVVKWTDY